MNHDPHHQHPVGEPARGGLRPAAPAACRQFLRDQQEERANDHGTQCPACAGHVAFQLQAAQLLRRRPAMPAALLSRQILEATQERLVASIEATSPLQSWLSKPAVAPDAAAECPAPLLASPLADAASSSPQLPSAGAWGNVRQSLIADLAARRKARVRMGLWLGVAGIAAAALVSVMLLSPQGTTTPHTIVFTDLDTMPNVEFSVIRYGALR